jgi:predicted nucleotidyltransferase component of viral defense system
VISRAEVAEWAERFGVAPEQIQRDHLISHVLAALGAEADAETTFYGGTALCRSYLDGSRLSEDVDLLHPSPAECLALLAELLPRTLQREFPDLDWMPRESRAGSARANVGTRGLTPIRLEISRFGPDQRAWRYEPTAISLRYSDTPGVSTLSCPTVATFAAMKSLAWYDRHTPRDLFDLAGLSDIGALNAEAEELLRSAAGHGYLAVEFTTIPGPTVAAWDTELGAQVGELPSPEACAARVLRSIRQPHS